MGERIRENKMGVMSVSRLLVSMALPMMISMLVQALYNIVDSMFVSRLSENALTAVSLAFPAQNLIIAVSTGTGVGINALLSKSLGEKNFDLANKTANNGIFLAIVSYMLFALLGGLFSRVFYMAQTDIAEIVDGGTVYLMICTMGSFGIFGQIVFERLLQSTGKTLYSMILQLVGALINLVLDPILIFGLLGFPKMGVAGAALATILGQIVAAILGVIFNIKKNTEIALSLNGLKPEGHVIKRIYAVGIPSIIMASIGSVMTFAMNKILIAFTSTATAVFGVYFKLQSFVFMPVFGLNNGLVPIISYNYGAQKKERMIKTIKLGMCYAVCLMLVGMVVFWILPKQLLQIFNASETMLAIGIPALRIISLSFTFAGICICTVSVCQAMGRGFLSLIMSAIRQLVVLLPVAYLLSRMGGLDAIWWAFPIAEVVALLLCIGFLRDIFKKQIASLPSGS